jgi:hypothetical protein
MSPVTTLEELTDGIAFLSLLNNLCPDMIEAIMSGQNDTKDKNRFNILFAALSKMGLSYPEVASFTEQAIGN